MRDLVLDLMPSAMELRPFRWKSSSRPDTTGTKWSSEAGSSHAPAGSLQGPDCLLNFRRCHFVRSSRLEPERLPEVYLDIASPQ